jgi:hypothetical protein
MEDLVQKTYDKLSCPLSDYINESGEVESLRDLLDIYHPHRLYNMMHKGVKDFYEEYGEYTSDETDEMLKQTVSKVDELSDQLYEVWQSLDEYERNQVWNAIGEGIYSDETIFGTAVGTMILPGIGTIIGAYFGGRAAGKRVQEQVSQAVEYYTNGVSKFIDIFDDIIKEAILPSTFSDFKRLLKLVEGQEQNQNVLLSKSDSSNITDDTLNRLERLSRLKENGTITEDEFKKMKQNILSKS